jgi:endonuclease/exonuclease/phosphatase family metal-dependent hydrolase
MQIRIPALIALRVLTFNAAGIPLVHPRLAERLEAAGRVIRDGGYDLVGLQELWRDKDAAALAKAAGLEHAARVPRKVAFGSGLAILSRWPIVKTEHGAFSSVRPSLRHPFEGEFVPSKGWLLARVATPWGELDAYSAHTLSDYPEARYHLLRMTELFELAEAIEANSAGRPFVVLGDLNSGPGDWEYDAFLDLLGLRDLGAGRIDHVLVPGALSARGRKVLEAPVYSDHDGWAADLPRAVMALRAKPDPKRRAQSLSAVDDALTAAIARLDEGKRGKAWIPIYGAFLAARYDRQIERLSALREKSTRPR